LDIQQENEDNNKMHGTKHLRLFAANPTRKPNAAANSADANVLTNKNKKIKI